jgi:serine/threonine protein kinase
MLGGIVLRGRLGEGGMGTVYYGVTPDGDSVAVKTIRSDRFPSQLLKDRFDQEVRTMQMVHGPGVAHLLAASETSDQTDGGTDDVRWLATEYIQGLTLEKYVEDCGLLDAALAAALGIALADALATIHSAGVLHRDLKPANIVLGKDGPRVVDFGLAAAVEAPARLTVSNVGLGTPLCMSPEQVRSSRDAGAPTDVHALGATLLYAVTGHYPYERETVSDIHYAITDPGTPPDLSGVPSPLLPAIEQMLARSAAARPDTSQVRAELAAVLAVLGWTDPGAALVWLARQTYRERPDDPPPADPPRQPSRTPPEASRVPGSLVIEAAERLRRGYARDAPF